jgi:hypothetical protein
LELISFRQNNRNQDYAEPTKKKKEPDGTANIESQCRNTRKNLLQLLFIRYLTELPLVYMGHQPLAEVVAKQQW